LLNGGKSNKLDFLAKRPGSLGGGQAFVSFVLACPPYKALAGVQNRRQLTLGKENLKFREFRGFACSPSE